MNLDRFKAKKIAATVTVGESLKQKREELDISIEDVSRKLKIKVNYLKDLEENNFHKLPPDVYVKGFIKSYARMIGLDSETMANLYNHEKIVRNKINEETERQSLKRNFSRPSYAIITPRAVTVFFSLLILSAISYYFWYQIGSFNSTPYLLITSPPINEIVVETSEIVIEGKADADAVLKINGEDVFVDSSGYFKANVMLQGGGNTLVVEATNKFGRTAREKINVIYEKKLEPVPISNDKEINSKIKGNHFDLEEKIETIGP